jgi:hypothetical protein
MSFRITWDSDQIIGDLHRCATQVASPYNDGFSAWGCKQDLLQVKYELDAMLQDLPAFADEADYIRELEKKTVWKTLTRS